MLRDFAAAGGTVLLISSDLDELLALCARLWVLCRGRATEVAADQRDPERLGLLMAGARRRAAYLSASREIQQSRGCAGLNGLVRSLAALAIAAALISLVLLALGASPIAVFTALGQGAFGDWFTFTETLVKATPLLFTGLAVAIAFQSAIWNIGADGQLLIGALAAGAIGPIAHRPAASRRHSAALSGRAHGRSHLGRTRWMAAGAVQVNEVISTIMLNFVAAQLLSWAVHGPLIEVSHSYPQSRPIARAALSASVVPAEPPQRRDRAGADSRYCLLGLSHAYRYWLSVTRDGP